MSIFAVSPFVEIALGVVCALAFTAICIRDIRAGVTTYLLAGWLPLDTIPLEGNRITAGLRPAETLASVLVVIWLVFWRRTGRPMFPERFGVALALLIPVSVLSLLTGFAFADPAVDARHLKPLVSIGQILLLAWPIAIYAATADIVTDAAFANRMIERLAMVGVLSHLVPLLPPGARDLVGWTQPLALFASPFCLVVALSPGAVWRRVWMTAVWLAPLVIGLWAGRAFYYGYWAAATATVIALTLRRNAITAAPLIAAVAIFYVALVPDRQLPGPLRALVEQETAQQSIGGRSGRLAIWADTIGIWSDHVLLGVGPGNNWPYMDRYSVIGTPHSQYFNLLLELGVAGLGCFLAFVALAWKATRLALARAATVGERRYLLGWTGCFAGMVFGCLVGDFMLPSIRNYGLELFSQFYPFWVVLGVMAGIARAQPSHGRAATSGTGAGAAGDGPSIRD